MFSTFPNWLTLTWSFKIHIRLLGGMQENRIFPSGSAAKNSPIMQFDPWVRGRSPGGGHRNPPSILAWRVPWTRTWRATVHRAARSRARLEVTKHTSTWKEMCMDWHVTPYAFVLVISLSWAGPPLTLHLTPSEWLIQQLWGELSSAAGTPLPGAAFPPSIPLLIKKIARLSPRGGQLLLEQFTTLLLGESFKR